MYWFAIKNTLKFGIKSLWMHRLRSTLTTIGIVFGVCSVIAMLAIGEGASREAQASIAQLGSTNIIMETVAPSEKQANRGDQESMCKYGLTYVDAESIRNTIPTVEVTVPIREIEQEARYMSNKAAVKIIGTIPWYTEISPVHIERGRFLSSVDLTYRLPVCVLDDSIAIKLFAFDDPLGKDLNIQGSYYRVVGIVSHIDAAELEKITGSKTTGAKSSGGAAGNVYIPLTTAKSRFSEVNYTFTGGSSSLEQVELQKITVKVKSIEDVLPTRDIINTLLDRLHAKEDYRIVVPLELLRQIAYTRYIFSIVLGSIAAISLLVGGIGIMNIMLASVSERTKEIGIRRALGARKLDIIIQFLAETVLLTLLGGIIGIILGSIIPFLVTYFGHMPTVITGLSLVLAFGISGAVGVAFGLYPAYRAANVDPIQSLRHE